MTNFNPSVTRSFRRNPQKEKGRDPRRTLLPQTAKLLVITLFCSLFLASCGVGVDTARINVQTPPLFDLDTYPGVMVAGFHFKFAQAPQTDLDKLSRELIKEDLAIFFKKPITEAPKAELSDPEIWKNALFWKEYSGEGIAILGGTFDVNSLERLEMEKKNSPLKKIVQMTLKGELYILDGKSGEIVFRFPFTQKREFRGEIVEKLAYTQLFNAVFDRFSTQVSRKEVTTNRYLFQF